MENEQSSIEPEFDMNYVLFHINQSIVDWEQGLLKDYENSRVIWKIISYRARNWRNN